MPQADWQQPMYGDDVVLEMETLDASPRHPHELVRQWEEHVLLLTFHKGGSGCWGMAWLARNGKGPWYQVLRTVNLSRDGSAERNMIRESRERIIGKVN